MLPFNRCLLDQVTPALIPTQGPSLANDNEGGAGTCQPHIHASLICHKPNALPHTGAHCAEDCYILFSTLYRAACGVGMIPSLLPVHLLVSGLQRTLMASSSMPHILPSCTWTCTVIAQRDKLGSNQFKHRKKNGTHAWQHVVSTTW